MIELLICVGVVVIPQIARTLIADVGVVPSLAVGCGMFAVWMLYVTGTFTEGITRWE